MAHLSMGLQVEVAFFRVEHTTTLLPALQLGAGFSVAYSLLPFNLPFTVELDCDWIYSPERSNKPAFVGFYPIAIWKRPVVAGQNPVDQIRAGLEALARDPTVAATTFVMAGTLAPLMQQLAADQDLSSFFANPRGNSFYSQGLVATENWLGTGDTSNAPVSAVPGDDKNVPEVVKPILVGTQLAFQTGYRVGAQSNPNSKWTYVDGLVTNYCYIGERCIIELKAKELSDVISNTVPADFERAWIGFSYPQEYLMTLSTINNPWLWVQMTNGVAQFILNESFATPQIVRVRYSDVDSGNWNKGINIELKSHLLIFLDPTDANHNGIPDWWEQKYGLTNSVAGTDTDHDGFTDYQEYIAGTDPTNPNDYPRLVLTQSLFQNKKLTIPYTDSARRYTIEGNTNATLLPNQWFVVGDFFGSNAPSDVDISPYLSATNALFRMNVRRY